VGKNWRRGVGGQEGCVRDFGAHFRARHRNLKIKARTLKKLMDADLVMGYAVQTLISRVYFKRYVETMGRL